MYSGYGILFHGGGSWNFGKGKARNILIFNVDNSSSFHVLIILTISFYYKVRNQLMVLMEALVYQR